MKVYAKLGAFAAVLALAGGGGAALGAVTGPVDTGGDEHGHTESAPGDRWAEGRSPSESSLPTGLVTSQAGYTLEADDTVVEGPGPALLQFRIRGPEGRVVTQFEPRHERELHLVVVGADLFSYVHLHPTRAADGTWNAELPPLLPGVHRAFADFAVAGGPELVLGVDLAVPGNLLPLPLLPPSSTTTVDGYEVALSGATWFGGGDAEVTFTITQAGRPVEDLAPYLGALGHLVVVRAGDLAYLHVHPLDEGGAGAGPSVRFAVEVPSPGAYRLFFDFAPGGQVRTAAFTIDVPAEATGGNSHEPSGGHSGAGPSTGGHG
jgi:hypothetical protein